MVRSHQAMLLISRPAGVLALMAVVSDYSAKRGVIGSVPNRIRILTVDDRRVPFLSGDIIVAAKPSVSGA
jgi:hypothetical protein